MVQFFGGTLVSSVEHFLALPWQVWSRRTCSFKMEHPRCLKTRKGVFFLLPHFQPASIVHCFACSGSVDNDGCFSGCAAIDTDGTPCLLYSAVCVALCEAVHQSSPGVDAGHTPSFFTAQNECTCVRWWTLVCPSERELQCHTFLRFQACKT